MQPRIRTWVAVLALAGLLVADANAFGRRCRAGRSSSGCGSGSSAACGTACSAAYGCGSGSSCSSGSCGGGAVLAWYGGLPPPATTWAWRQVGDQVLLEDTAAGVRYAAGSDGVYRPVDGAAMRQPVIGTVVR